jgi:hypothetical protein
VTTSHDDWWVLVTTEWDPDIEGGPPGAVLAEEPLILDEVFPTWERAQTRMLVELAEFEGDGCETCRLDAADYAADLARTAPGDNWVGYVDGTTYALWSASSRVPGEPRHYNQNAIWLDAAPDSGFVGALFYSDG